MPNRKKIFLAHAKEDVNWVRAFYDLLKTIEVKPWMAPNDIIPGEQWDSAIKRAIATADFVVACLSRNSTNKRGYVQKEFRLALDMCNEIPSTKTF